jgi:hypothetical protein
VLGEVAATLSLKAALDEPAWYALVVTGVPCVETGSHRPVREREEAA